MAMVDVDGSSHFIGGLEPRLVGWSERCRHS